MFCLDCGHKIVDGQESCPHCGMTLFEMNERLARAREMVLYADTLGPEETHVLPIIEQDGKYFDFDGNEFKIIQAEEAQQIQEARRALGSLPNLSGGDPYITMPVKKIVSEQGSVIADEDRTPKWFLDSSQITPQRSKRKIFIALFVAILGVVLLGVILWLLF